MKEKIWGNSNRLKLSDVLPIATPFTLVIGASSKCNFKCNYCLQALPKESLDNMEFKQINLDFKLFKKVIDDCQKFPERIKCIQFLKDGEPLMNKRLPEMISYAKKSDKFERIELITNGVLLSEEINTKLIDAGLDKIRISLQGLSSKKYFEITGVLIDFNKFIYNIEHLYTNRRKCLVHLKMIDSGLENERENFFEIFDSICDEFSIQYVMPFYEEHIDYKIDSSEKFVNLYGEKSKKVEICPRPFMSISVSADGSIMPCCRENNKEIILGKASSDSIYEIWNGSKLNQFRVDQLSKDLSKYSICRECCMPSTTTYDEDNLDGFEENLLRVYNKKGISGDI